MVFNQLKFVSNKIPVCFDVFLGHERAEKRAQQAQAFRETKKAVHCAPEANIGWSIWTNPAQNAEKEKLAPKSKDTLPEFVRKKRKQQELHDAYERDERQAEVDETDTQVSGGHG